jgi:GTP:adenosylcobinamide-phosphate guanylyltransferase
VDAIVTAGGCPQVGDALYEFTQGGYKAMLDIAGLPMIQWVMNGLSESQTIERVVIVGSLLDSSIHCTKHFDIIPDQGSMLGNLRGGINRILEINPSTAHVLVVSSDIPGITSIMLDWMVNSCKECDDDFYYPVIVRQVMEQRYPGSKRTYNKLKDIEFCGGDIGVIRTQTILENNKLWEKIVDARKTLPKMASLIGYDSLLLLLFRLTTLKQTEQLVSKRLRKKLRILVSPYAEIGMDVDNPIQLQIIRNDLELLRAKLL